MTTGVNLVLFVSLIPFRDRRRLVHVLDDLSPSDAGVVGAEGNLTELSRVRNDAHFRAAEVVVEQILEPHTGDKEEVPRILPSSLNVRHGAVAHNLAVAPAGQ